jgi:hypothetical protein
MAPSHPAAVKAAAARELARRLGECGTKGAGRLLAALQGSSQGVAWLALLMTRPDDATNYSLGESLEIQLAALEVLGALRELNAVKFCDELVGQPKVTFGRSSPL